MATRRCLADPTYSGGWSCPCESGGDFCSHCLLSHLSTPGLVHTPTPIVPPLGDKVCGRCHSETLEAICTNYDFCLCAACASELCTSQQVGVPVPPISKPSLPVRENLSRGSLCSTLRRLIEEGRADIHQSLRRISTLEDLFKEAVEAQLAGSQAEAMRKRSKLAEERTSDSLELMEAAGLENRGLKKLNQDLAKEVEELREKLNNLSETRHNEDLSMLKTVQQLQNTVETLKKTLDEKNREMTISLKEIVTEATQSLERSINEKNAEVALLSEEIKAMKSTHAKERTTALPNTEEMVDADMMKEAICTVTQMTKFAGFGVTASAFAQKVGTRLCGCKEDGLRLLGCMCGIYEIVKKEEAGKYAIESLMNLLETNELAFNVAASVVMHLGKIADASITCELVTAACEFFSAHPEDEVWRECLLGIPVHWKGQCRVAAKQSISDYLRCLSRMGFSNCYLHLPPLLKSPAADLTSLFILVSRLSEAMQNQSISATIGNLSLRVAAYIRAAVEGGTAKQEIDVWLTIVAHLLRGKDTTKAEAEEAIALHDCIPQDKELMRFATVLLQVYGTGEKADPRLIRAAMAWARAPQYPNIPFLLSLFRVLQESLPKDRASATGLELLAFLLQNQEVCRSYISAGDLCEFWVSLPPEMRELVFGMLSSLRVSSDIFPKELFQYTKSLLKVSTRLVSHLYKVLRKLTDKRVSTQVVANLGKGIMNVALTKPEECFALLDAVLQSAVNDDLKYSWIPSICYIWLRCRATPLKQVYCSNLGLSLLKILQEDCQEAKELLGTVDAVLAKGNGVHLTTVVLLANIYIENRRLTHHRAQQFIRGTCNCLLDMEGMKPSERSKLEALTMKAVDSLKESREASLLFLQGAYTLCSQSCSHVANLNSALDSQSALLIEMSWINSFEHYTQLLKAACPQNTDIIHKLCGFTVFIESQGFQVPKLPSKIPPEQSTAIIEFLSSVVSMVTRHPGLYQVGYRLLNYMEKQATDEVLQFVPWMATELIDVGAQVELVASWCDTVLGELDNGRAWLQSLVQSWSSSVASGCAANLTRLQGKVNLWEMENNMCAFTRKLAMVQRDSIQLFDFHIGRWGDSMPLKQAIQATDTSEWVFLDNRTLFYCGGIYHAG